MPEEEAVDACLEPGEASVHHIKTVHGSGPNLSDGRRIGIALRYMASSVKQYLPERDSVTLVAGDGDFPCLEAIATMFMSCADRQCWRHQPLVSFPSREEAVADADLAWGLRQHRPLWKTDMPCPFPVFDPRGDVAAAADGKIGTGDEHEIRSHTR